MRRMGTEEWSGLAMLVVSIAVGGPVLFGAADTAIPRGWWIAVFAVLIVTLLGALLRERPVSLRYTLFAIAVMSSWAVVLTAPSMGLLSILLVVTAAASAYIVPLPVAFTLVGLNTIVLALLATQQKAPLAESVIVVGFYLLIQLASVLSSITLIREQRMRRELTEAHIDLRAATVLLAESARAAERLRISRELHDLVGHQLTVLTLELEAARHRPGEEARDHVTNADRVARALLTDVRVAVGRLRTESAHLTDALNQVVRDIPGLEVTVHVDPDARVHEEQVTDLVRAVQEIVTNTIRHADARALWITLTVEGESIVMTATDDGRGTAEVVPGNGLRGLVERFEALGGDVNFDGTTGFRVEARMPTP